MLLTTKGQKLFEAAIELQVPWVETLSTDLKLKDIATTQDVLSELKSRLEKQIEDGS